MRKLLLFTALLFFASLLNPARAQEDVKEGEMDPKEATKAAETDSHSIGKAMLLSAVLPGAGQLYNQNYWKPVLIWGGMGFSIFSAVDNHRLYAEFRDALNARVRDSIYEDDYVGIYSEDQLITYENFYRRQRDLSLLITAGIYLLNILDAYVDAHLFYYDVSDDLSLHWQPTSFFTPGQMRMNMGVQLKFNFR